MGDCFFEFIGGGGRIGCSLGPFFIAVTAIMGAGSQAIKPKALKKPGRIASKRLLLTQAMHPEMSEITRTEVLAKMRCRYGTAGQGFFRGQRWRPDSQ